MYVKTLTVKGFKSFASATTLRLEPGITCIVGPNGSGKSNVVDALAWVMGEQGAKTLRGGKMEDVIFAGTPLRPPLGRAEVALTLDNSDGALPIAYTEVTISRTMFRNGGSEYAINGTPCRLLDVQELLSDAGIGREMHVVVGQGQIDSILSAGAEERRGFIEEAAGVLKHRRRKERALRKLDAMEGNLTRVQDLTAEIRRQLGPLGRQAETARKAAVIQVEARDTRCRLLADDLVQAVNLLEADLEAENAVIARRDEAEQALRAARARLTQAEVAFAEQTPRLAACQERRYALASLRDRLEAVRGLAAERARLTRVDAAPGTSPQAGAARDPDQLAVEAQTAREQERALAAEVAAAEAALQDAVTQRRAAEEELAEEQRRLARVAAVVADRREGLATLAGQVAARRSRVEAGEAELGRLSEARAAAHTRAEEAHAEFTRLEGTVAVDEEGEEGLDLAYETAAAALEEATTGLSRIEEAERSAERDRAGAMARLDALESTMASRDGSQALLGQRAEGVLGSVATLLSVSSGHDVAIAAALGWLADAVAVESLDAAVTAVERLRDEGAGRAGMLVPPVGLGLTTSGHPPAPEGAVWAGSVVDCPAPLRASIDLLLDDVVLVSGTTDALRIARSHPGLTAVTAAGDVVAPGFVQGGGKASPSLLEIQAAVDAARSAVLDADHRREQAQFALAAQRERHRALASAAEAALADLHTSDARMAAVAEQLGSLGAHVRGARAEVARTDAAIAGAEEALARDREALQEARRRLDALQAEPVPEDPSTGHRDSLEVAATAARAAETEARLRVGALSERARAQSGRAQRLEAAAHSERAAAEEARRRRAVRAEQARVATAVSIGAEHVARGVSRALQGADADRAEAEAACRAADLAIHEARPTVDRLADDVRALVESVHRDEVARAEQRLRIDALRTRSLDELGVDPEVLVDEYGPHRPIPRTFPGDTKPSEEPADTVAYDREAVEKRLRVAERKLAQLGRINPLALEEYTALEERHTFLTEQIDDLRRSKRDLLDIVRDVDHRVEQAFADAFADTAAEFEGVFAQLFPGGVGRLALTDPENLLTTGIEVEARLPGKRVTRLSLLSGGERSLTAIALLLAIFKARPSPFYILDEVEAALDDTNLGRLLGVFEDVRDTSQLIVITHQKRTMEVADALYGVSMRGDGVTTLVSQRLRDARTA